jgi:hypothetical protein
MPFLKLLIAGAIMACFVGAGSFAVLGIDEVADDVWGGRGYGGGCHGSGGYYRDNNYRNGEEYEPPCHRWDDDYEHGEYCEYHEEYFSEEEWEGHWEECPYYDEEA